MALITADYPDIAIDDIKQSLGVRLLHDHAGHDLVTTRGSYSESRGQPPFDLVHQLGHTN